MIRPNLQTSIGTVRIHPYIISLCSVTMKPMLLTAVTSAVPDLEMTSMEHSGLWSLALQRHIETTLTKALDDRVTLVQAKPSNTQLVSVDDFSAYNIVFHQMFCF